MYIFARLLQRQSYPMKSQHQSQNRQNQLQNQEGQIQKTHYHHSPTTNIITYKSVYGFKGQPTLPTTKITCNQNYLQPALPATNIITHYSPTTNIIYKNVYGFKG